MITTIIFDLSEVLIGGLAGSEKHLQKAISKPIVFKDLCIPELDLLFRGQITEDTYWQSIIRRYKWNTPIRNLKDAVRRNFEEIAGTRGIIEKLKSNKYTLGLLSNHAREWIAFCEKIHQYHKLFNSVVYSFEVATSKPNKKMYTTILKRLRVQPYECLFIDDNIKYLTVAEKLQFKTIRFTSPKNLREELVNLGIVGKTSSLTGHHS